MVTAGPPAGSKGGVWGSGLWGFGGASDYSFYLNYSLRITFRDFVRFTRAVFLTIITLGHREIL